VSTRECILLLRKYRIEGWKKNSRSDITENTTCAVAKFGDFSLKDI
jgi:hypothetical protein